ncbi:MAG: hypothetical protein V4686_02495 [Patescibacteria group bacterium]
MLYLINEEQRKKIIADYYIRVGQVVSWFLVGIFLTIGVLAVPTILLLQTEVRTSEQKILNLEREIETAKDMSTEKEATVITNKLEIFKTATVSDIQKRYLEVENTVESVPGVLITGLNVNVLNKTVQIVTEVKDKEVAKDLVDVLNKTTYKGAVLPYSVLSEKGSFIFAQNLTYE